MFIFNWHLHVSAQKSHPQGAELQNTNTLITIGPKYSVSESPLTLRHIHTTEDRALFLTFLISYTFNYIIHGPQFTFIYNDSALDL